MINWLHVVFNSLWIIGCAIILAAFSHTSWMAHRQRVHARRLLSAAAFQFPFSAGLSLVSLGLFYLSNNWLERGIWAAFVVLFVWRSWRFWRGSRS